MKVFGYARVSTAEQAEDKEALVKQVKRLRVAGATTIYFDVESRTSDHRRGFLQLIADINSSKLGTVSEFIFLRIDRLTSSNNMFYLLMDALRKKNISPRALDEPFDILSIGGELTIDVRLAAAKYEVKMLALRIKKEREVRKQQHKPHWNAPFGYVVKDDLYCLDNTECICILKDKTVLTKADLMRYVFDTFLEVGTISRTVKTLHGELGIESKAVLKGQQKRGNLIAEDDDISIDSLKKLSNRDRTPGYLSRGLKWSIAGLRNTLVNPVYAGGTPYDLNIPGKKYRKRIEETTCIWGTHGNRPADSLNKYGAAGEAVITRKEYDYIQRIIIDNRNNRWGGDKKENNIFAGLLKCGICGAAYTKQSKKIVKTKGFVRYHYQCGFYRTKACSSKGMISSDRLENEIIEQLTKEAERLSVLGLDSPPGEKEQESDELISLRSSLVTLEKAPFHSAIEQAKKEIREQILFLEQKESSELGDFLISQESIINAFSDPEYWKSLYEDEKYHLLRACVKKIILIGGAVQDIIFN